MVTNDGKRIPGKGEKATSQDIIFQAKEAYDALEPDGYNPLLDSDEEDDDEGAGQGLALPDMPLPGFGSLRDVQRSRPAELPDPFALGGKPVSDQPPRHEEAMFEDVPPEVAPAVEEPIVAIAPEEDKDDLEDLLKEFSFIDEPEDPYSNPLDEAIEGAAEASTADTRDPHFKAAWGNPEDDDDHPDDGLSQFMDSDDEEEEDAMAGFDLDSVLSLAIDAGASDVHISADDEVCLTVLGEIIRISQLGNTYGEVSGDVTLRLQQAIISHVLESDFVQELELDTSYVLRTGPHKGRRTRLSVGKSFNKIFMVFRVIADQIPTPDELGVEESIQQWCSLPNGLVLICGPTGTGKSTTFASMIKKIQLERAQKIITIEKPVEFVYGNEGKALITQREVGKDAREFSSALTSAMRQAPDIIMIGEVRNQLEVDEVLRASETGHLALTTLHASSPPGAINRIKSLYSGEDQLRILASLKDNCRGIANQVLVKTRDGKSRFAVRSVLNVTPEVSLMIGEGNVEGINEYMRKQGTTMEHGLVKAVREGRCTLAAAKAQSPFPAYFDELMGEE